MAKKKDRINIPEKQKALCNGIIHGASAAAATAATPLAQLPVADAAVITPIQIGMIVALGKVFDQSISKSAASAILKSAGAAFVGRAASQFLLGWIPFAGNAINATTAAALTEAIGWTAVDGFSKKQYADVIQQNPIGSEDAAEAGDAIPSEVLTARAEEFFSGVKTPKENKEEYDQLLSDIALALFDRTDDDPMQDIFNRLTSL